jgi:aryl sulfotransferase
MAATIPERTREYRNHHLDSTRWDHFEPRDDDIVVTTAYKAGTTWTQRIVSLLIFDSPELHAPMARISPWVDMNTRPLAEVVAELAGEARERRLQPAR